MYTWTPYTLYREGEIVGNVAMIPMPFYLGGSVTEMLGVASVAIVAMILLG